MSDNALRVSAAFKDTKSIIPRKKWKDLIVIGMVGMIDPPRLEVGIRSNKENGRNHSHYDYRDHKNTAVAIAKELGIAESIDQSLTVRN